MNLEDMNDDQLRSYVKELRQENKDRREESQVYNQVFSKFSPREQQGLLNMVSVLADDKVEGAKMFQSLAKSVLSAAGETDEEEEIEMSEENEVEETEPKPDATQALIEAAVEKAVSKVIEEMQRPQQEAQEAQVAQWIAEAEALGYKEGTTEFSDLFLMASRLPDGDLTKAHERLEKFNASLSDGEEVEEGEEDEDGVKFPKTGEAGSKGGALKTKEGDGEEFDLKDQNAVRAKVMAMIDSSGGDDL